jgi:hypothetical protein
VTRRRCGFLQQFHAVVSDEERLFLSQRPVDGNTGKQVFTGVAECPYVVLDLHRVEDPKKR